MVFYCDICKAPFSSAAFLKKHHKKDIPCDLTCKLCKHKFDDRFSYSRHVKKCEPIEHTQEEYEKVKKDGKIVNVNTVNNHSEYNNCTNVSNINNNINNNNNINLVFNIGDLKMSRLKILGFQPHEFITYDADSHFQELISGTIVNFVNSHKNILFTKEELRNLIVQLAGLIHSNMSYPEYMNIMDDNTTSNKNKIYSGQCFIEDVVSKTNRNRKILLNVLNRVKICSNNLPRNYEQFKPYIDFMDIHLIPILQDACLTDNISDELQKTWQYNKTVIDSLPIETFPKCDINSEYMLTPQKLKNQVVEIAKIQRDFYNTIASVKERELINQFNEYINKITY